MQTYKTTYGYQRLVWRREGSRSLNLAKKWINKKVLLYSRGNYIQFHLTNHNGKNIKIKV